LIKEGLHWIVTQERQKKELEQLKQQKEY